MVSVQFGHVVSPLVRRGEARLPVGRTRGDVAGSRRPPPSPSPPSQRGSGRRRSSRRRCRRWWCGSGRRTTAASSARTAFAAVQARASAAAAVPTDGRRLPPLPGDYDGRLRTFTAHGGCRRCCSGRRRTLALLRACLRVTSDVCYFQQDRRHHHFRRIFVGEKSDSTIHLYQRLRIFPSLLFFTYILA